MFAALLSFLRTAKKHAALPVVLTAAAALAATAVLGMMPAHADRPDKSQRPSSTRQQRDHDLARQALQDGAVLALRAILDIVEREHPGQIMEVEFERDGGRFVYELKVLQQQGRLVKLKLDARTGEILKASGKMPKPTAKPEPASAQKQNGRQEEKQSDKNRDKNRNRK